MPRILAVVADYLATKNGGVRPTAINGETTTSFFSGLVADRDSLDGVTLNSRYAGYPVVSRQLLPVAPVPAPPAAVLAGLAVVGLCARRRLVG